MMISGWGLKHPRSGNRLLLPLNKLRRYPPVPPVPRPRPRPRPHPYVTNLLTFPASTPSADAISSGSRQTLPTRCGKYTFIASGWPEQQLNRPLMIIDTAYKTQNLAWGESLGRVRMLVFNQLKSWTSVPPSHQEVYSQADWSKCLSTRRVKVDRQHTKSTVRKLSRKVTRVMADDQSLDHLHQTLEQVSIHCA